MVTLLINRLLPNRYRRSALFHTTFLFLHEREPKE